MSGDVTESLQRWSRGDRRALDDVLQAVYSELGGIASRYLRKERRGHTLQTSALVHEAYLRLVDQERAHWRDRAHFFAVASQVMRRLLVDHARSRGRHKRGGGVRLQSFDETLVVGRDMDPAILALEDALEVLASLDPELVEIIELRFYGGLENREISALKGVSERTVIRRWKTAQAWLYRHLHEDGTVNGA